MRRDLFMGKLNLEKFSQRLQDLNRYLDFIPNEKTSDNHKINKAYGNSLPEDEIRSIMGRAVPPERTVNLLALVKEPWRFKDIEDQLNMYRQQWQVDQQKQIIAKMAGKMPGKTNEGKRKSNDRNHHNSNGGRSSTRQGNTSRGDAEDVEEAVVDTVEDVKLPQPQPRTRTYIQTCQSTLRATQVIAALSHAYAVTYQNRITDKP
jgi:hypothetical protein